MNILIVGGGSFIAKSIFPNLNQRYKVTSLNKKQLNLLNINDLQEFFKDKYFDFIINCAIVGGRLLGEDNPNIFYQNVLIQENLLKFSNNCGKFIFFGSGGQEDRTKDICNLKEGEFRNIPQNCYSLSKFINTQRTLNNNRVILLRIFNIFGPEEPDNRFIKSSILKYINHKDIEIWSDKLFDFFGWNDLCIALEYILNNPSEKYFELNLVYFKKYLMSEIVGIINRLDNYNVPVKILDNGVNKHYYGSGFKLAEMGLKLNGLNKEIENIYLKLKNENI